MPGLADSFEPRSGGQQRDQAAADQGLVVDLVMSALVRTRELSLLRLVGMTRRQISRMVCAEQAGLLGVALTIGVAIAAVSLSSIVNAVAGQRIPHVPGVGWLAVLGGTVTLALVASVLPVRRILTIAPVTGIGVPE